jgi:uncharacterized protein YjiS (DUF1127 family)
MTAHVIHAGKSGDTFLSLFGKKIRARLARRAIYVRTFRELNALSDHELDDIGLSRGMIHEIALDASMSDDMES